MFASTCFFTCIFSPASCCYHSGLCVYVIVSKNSCLLASPPECALLSMAAALPTAVAYVSPPKPWGACLGLNLVPGQGCEYCGVTSESVQPVSLLGLVPF